MEDKYEARPLRERVGLRVWPFDPATTVPLDPATTISIMSEVEDAGVPHIWLPYGPPWNPDRPVSAILAKRYDVPYNYGWDYKRSGSRGSCTPLEDFHLVAMNTPAT